MLNITLNLSGRCWDSNCRKDLEQDKERVGWFVNQSTDQSVLSLTGRLMNERWLIYLSRGSEWWNELQVSTACSDPACRNIISSLFTHENRRFNVVLSSITSVNSVIHSLFVDVSWWVLHSVPANVLLTRCDSSGRDPFHAAQLDAPSKPSDGDHC